MKHLYTFLISLAILSAANPLFAQSGLWLHYSKANSGLPGDTVTAIGFDGSGGVWIGTGTEGLAKLQGTNWQVFNDFSKVPSNDINTISNAFGSMWIGTSDGLTKTDGTTWTTYTTGNSGLADNAIWSVAPDNANNLWIGTNSGLNKLTAGTSWATYSGDNVPTFPDSHFQVVAPDGNGFVWTSFISAYGMAKFNVANPTATRLINQDSISNFPGDHVMGITTDWSGNTWAAMWYTGLVKTNGTTATVYSKATTPSWPSDNMHAVAVDQCGHVWAGSDRGSMRYDGSWTMQTSEASQLVNDTVNTIAVDGSGHIWFGTNGGVSEFKPIPEKPTLSSPANQVTVVTDSVNCHWAWDCPAILKYWFEIADNAAFNNSMIDTTSTSLTQSASRWDSNFVNRKTYYWRVKAENDAGWGPMSDVWSFTYIMPVPQKPALLSPANGLTIRKDSVTCFWTLTTPHVQKYWYELSNTAQFTTSIVDTTSSTEETATNHWNTNLLDNHTYFWRVKAENAEAWGPFSDAWSFTYNSAAGVTDAMMRRCSLAQNYPNPFSDETTVRFSIAERANVSLRVYDALGRECGTVMQSAMDPGEYSVPIDASMLTQNGIYIYRLTVGSECMQRMMQVLR